MNPYSYHPGPWHYCYGSVWTTPNGPEDGGQCIAQRASASTIDPSIKDRSLRLCAAAPDLLAACEAALLREDIADSELGHQLTLAVMKAREPQPQFA